MKKLVYFTPFLYGSLIRASRRLVRIFAVWLAAWLFSCGLSARDDDRRNAKADSLEKMLASHAAKSADLLPVYEALSRAFVETDHEKTVHYSRKGIAIARSSGEWLTVGELYKNMGYSYYSRNNYDSARFCFQKVLDASERTPREEDKNYLRIKAWLHNGILADVEGKLQEAIDCYLKALKIAESIDSKQEMQKLYGNIGSAYFTMENDRQAEIYFTKGEQTCRELNDPLEMCYHLLGLSHVHLRQKNYEKAMEQAEAAYHIVRTQPSLILDKFFVYQTLARIHSEGTGHYDRALAYAQKALEAAESINSPQNVCWALETVSAIYIRHGKYAEAEASALRALATDSTDMFTNVKLFEYLTRAGIMLGKKDMAIDCLGKVIAITGESSGRRFQTALSEMEVKYETEKKEVLIAMLEEEKRWMTWLSIAGATVLLLALATFFFLWRWTVQKKRTAEQQKLLAEQQIKQLEQEKQLIATQAVLDGETQERTRLARDLHDGLGSMLTGVKLNLESAKSGAVFEPSAAAYFNSALKMLDESMHELRRVAHHLMPEALIRYGLKPSIGDFCRSLSSSILFDWFGSEERIEQKLEAVIYRIIHELVNNALKYADASQIMVQIMQETDRIAFTVQDDGIGFDPSAESRGMGLSNIRTRVASFGGNISIDSKTGEGTEISVELKIER
ncbi:MAG: histidine kinase [Tannerella sp.]|jgi:signal transduction histidine kinase|nr:histidine kinase [Tannerella sp.]